MVILLGVCALVVVNALKRSPWGTFTIAMTIPIALLMGVYLRRLRPGKVLETSVLGFVLVMLAIWGGQWVSQTPRVARWFTLSAPTLAIMIIIYGFAASAVPVWLLLAPRDYLSTFVKLGTIAMLAVGIIALHPRCICRHSLVLLTAPARSSLARSFRLPSSPSPAAPSAASIL